MVAVLDQFEIENSKTYQSGSYDQVVMGSMYSIRSLGGRKFVVAGQRGVVYGSVDNDVAPGTTPYESSNSVSYRSQPFSEKSGNTRAAKLTCREERIYDSMPPHAWSCFKRNGANVFICAVDSGAPGYPGPLNGLDYPSVGYIIFDNYVRYAPNSRKALNAGVDRHWTKSFPFEPKYSTISRQNSLKFLREDVYATYNLNFETNGMFPALPISPIRVKGAYLGVVGPETIGQHSAQASSEIPEGEIWKHHWACDVFDTFQSGEFPKGDLTSSMGTEDMAKVIYGFGDVNTMFINGAYKLGDKKDVVGTHNWPEFRKKFVTNPPPAAPPSVNYEYLTASMWCVSPVIRGWKYGLYSGLPAYTSAHFRQGRYGQFRDMLEQRLFTKLFIAKRSPRTNANNIIEDNTLNDGPVTVRFLDDQGNLTDPANTQSQNLSFEATSSLPYFDLQQKNRANTFTATNLELVNLGISATGEVTI